MREAQNLIRDVMRAHVASSRRVDHPWRKGFLINVAACAGEGCDWVAPDEDTDHAEHLAAEIDAALGGLTPTAGVRIRWADPDRSVVLTDATDIRTARKGHIGDAVVDVSGWVSGWTEVPR